MTQQFRNIKIRARNKEELVAIQKLLFANGCTWYAGSTKVQPTYGLCTFVDRTGLMTHSENMTPWRGENRDCKEVFIDFEQLLVASLRPVPERPKTVLFGKTYFTDDLNARLAGLETAQ